jgi:integrase
MEYHRAEHNVLRATREAAGLDWLTFHGLRHTCASLLFANGKNLKQVQHWLGTRRRSSRKTRTSI